MYQIPGLLDYPELFHAFSTKKEGNMANVILGREVAFKKTLKNRIRFLEKLRIDINKSICMWVVHEDGIEEANPEDAGKSMKDYNFAVRTDGLLTNKKGLYLFLLIADCLPVILYDPKNEALGLIHAGWKGVDINIVGKAIAKMGKIYKTKPCDLIVGLGPAAQKDSFIKENPSQITDPKWQPFLENTGVNLYKVDFVGLCKKQIQKTGVEAKNIFESQTDTVKDDRFYSHYSDKEKDLIFQGRFACIVGLNE